MTIQQLQYIVALDEYRHFVRAAESCFVAQPTLTLQVKKLEEEIGVAIFDRSAHPITPTQMGEKFIGKAREILREVQSLKNLVNEERNALSGTYRLGVIPTLAPYLLPIFLKEFSDAHPEIQLEIKELQSEEIIQRLNQGKLDMAILATPLEENGLREIPLFYESFLVYAHPEHPILEKKKLSAKELDDNGLWVLDQGHCFRNQVLNICEKAGQLNASSQLSFESGSIETLKNMIKGYSGYTLIPELAVDFDRDDTFIRRFQSPQPAREISLVVHNSFSKDLLLQHLRKSILDQVPDSFLKNEKYSAINWR